MYDRKPDNHHDQIPLGRYLLVICLVMILVFLAGCDQGSMIFPTPEVRQEGTVTATPERFSPSPTSLKSPTPSPEPVSLLKVEASELRGTTIRFWHIWSGEAGQVIQALVDAFNADNAWGIVVEPVYQGNLDDMDERVREGGAPQNIPDLVVGSFHQILHWRSTREVVDLAPYVNDPIWGFTPGEEQDFYSAFWEQDVLEGQRLAIPAQRSGQMLYYNTTWARELGFSVAPKTPQQFKEQACAAARANKQDDIPKNDGTGGWIISTNYSAILGWISAFGGNVITSRELDAGQSAYQFDTEQVQEAFAFLRDLYESGCAWLAENAYPEAEFAERLGLFATGSVLGIPYQRQTFQRTGSSDQWTVLPFPSPVSTPSLIVYGPSYAVFASTPAHQLAAWLFIKWLVAPQNQARLVEVTGAFPLRASAQAFLEDYRRRNPQWAAALDLLPLSGSEPPFLSWYTVRWALSDAATQLFRFYFTKDQIPNLVKFLDHTAADLHLGVQTGGVLSTPVGTPVLMDGTPIPSVDGTPIPSAPLPPTPTAVLPP